MTLLFIWPELPDSSFLGSSVFKKKKKKQKEKVLKIPTSEDIWCIEHFSVAFQIVKVTVEDGGHRNQSGLFSLKWKVHAVLVRPECIGQVYTLLSLVNERKDHQEIPMLFTVSSYIYGAPEQHELHLFC